MSLNPAQREAVEHDQGPMLVLAGAGSGKTRVITARIARLIERGTRPDAILGVTFTNKAAREMAERMVPLIGRERTERVWLSTFHSFGVRFLGEESKRLGFEGGRFVIFDQGDSLGLVKDILRTEVGITRNVDVPSLMTRISLWKNAFKGPDEIPASTFEYDAIAREVYPHYEDRMRRMHAVDFDDLVVLPVRILQQHEDVREKWRARFRYLLIDEFQDTNKSQLELVRALANSLNNVCVVGDDDQSIYGWRGAEVGNILDFERYFPGTKVVKLEDNYRSYAQILAVANAAIAQSRGKRHGKTLRAARGLGDKVRLVTTNDAANEVEFVVNEIHDLAQNHRVAFRDMAVLYRSNGQARILEEELRAGGIPYQLFGGTQFFDRKEVKDAIAYLRVVVSTRDELSIRRVINTPPRGLGDTSLDRIAGYGKLHGLSLFEALQRAEQVPGITEPAKRGAELFTQCIEHARTSLLREGAELVPTTKRLFEDAGYTRMLSAGADKDSQAPRGELRLPDAQRGALRQRPQRRKGEPERVSHAADAACGQRRRGGRQQGHAELAALQQGARVPGGVLHRPGGGHPAAQPHHGPQGERGRADRRGRRAAPVLRGRDARHEPAVPHAAAAAHQPRARDAAVAHALLEWAAGGRLRGLPGARARAHQRAGDGGLRGADPGAAERQVARGSGARAAGGVRSRA
jgi:superfamily I DNA/RNA helicase